MTAVADVLRHYGAILRQLGRHLAVHVLVRVVAGGILLPLAGLAATAAMSLSGNGVLTDQDILFALLSPAGIAAALAFGAVLLVAAILDVTVMAIMQHQREDRPGIAVARALATAFRMLPRLWAFALILAARIVVLSLPFLLAGAAVAWWFLTDYDINFYLAEHPPGFVAAVVLIGMILAALAFVLIRALSGWALALPLVVTGSSAPQSAFADSLQLLKGRRVFMARAIVIWLLVGLAASLVLGVLLDFVFDLLPGLAGANLERAALLSFVFIGGWTVLNAVRVAVMNGALARILVAEYARSPSVRLPLPEPGGATKGGHRTGVLVGLAAIGAIVVSSFWIDALLDRIALDNEVEIIAHRGAAGIRPENTMASILRAIEDKADWVEIDVQENADGTVIVAHDSDFMKLAGVATKVWDVTDEELATIDIGSWFGPDYAGERTPTLAAALRALKGTDSRLLIELKYYGHDVDLERKVVDLVEAEGMADRVAVMSLKPSGVAKLRAIRPGWKSGVLAAKAIGNMSRLDADFLAVNTGQVSSRFIERAHRAGQQVYVWTVNDPLTMSRMISMGVDGLITDEPALARQVLEHRRSLDASERLVLWAADQLSIGKYELVAPESDA